MSNPSPSVLPEEKEEFKKAEKRVATVIRIPTTQRQVAV